MRILTIRFLVSCSGTWTTKLLWLAPSWISNKKSTVILNEDILYLLFTCFINIYNTIIILELNKLSINQLVNINMLTFLIVCNKSFRNSLTNRVDLCNVTTTAYSHPDINSGKFFLKYKYIAYRASFSEKLHLSCACIQKQVYFQNLFF